MRKHGITTLELSLDHPLGSSNKIKICNAGFHGWRKNYVQGQDPTTTLSLCDAKFENQVCTTVGGGRRWALFPQYPFAWSQTAGTSHSLITVKLSNVNYELWDQYWLAVCQFIVCTTFHRKTINRQLLPYKITTQTLKCS